MKKTFITMAGICYALFASAQWQWHDPIKQGTKEITFIQNQGWNEDGGNYYRLPLRAKDKVRDKVWSLACETGGLSVRFRTDAREIKVQYTVTGGFSMPHMPATGVSGVDLYRDSDGAFCFGDYAFGDTIRYAYTVDRKKEESEMQSYTLYLPLYNGVRFLNVGVPEGADFAFLPASEEKPIVLYGTSIAQGACASRPGMAWGNIVSRSLHCPLINLGFSGNGKLEKELIDFLCEKEARLYILDCLPNLRDYTEKEIEERVRKAVQQIRSCHDTPILLIEHAGYSNGVSDTKQYDTYMHTNRAQRKAYEALIKAGTKGLYYLSREEIGMDPDSWVDYVHPSDYGMVQQAKAVIGKIRQLP